MTDLIKLVISGSVGAGKTSAIQSISGVPPVRTEAPITDPSFFKAGKTTTTVAMDYGELALDDGRILVIFGTPGQERYDFMCRILAKGALGILILIDHSGTDPMAELRYYLNLFGDLIEETGCVVGITHTDLDPLASVAPYAEALGPLAASVPVLALDPRRAEDVAAALEALLAVLESGEPDSESFSECEVTV